MHLRLVPGWPSIRSEHLTKNNYVDNVIKAMDPLVKLMLPVIDIYITNHQSQVHHLSNLFVASEFCIFWELLQSKSLFLNYVGLKSTKVMGLSPSQRIAAFWKTLKTIRMIEDYSWDLRRFIYKKYHTGLCVTNCHN